MVVSPLALTEPMTTVRSSCGGAGGAVTFLVQLAETNTMVINVNAIVEKRIVFLMINIFE
jgi:hypothetical protein